jgi:hypothetical protein
MKQDLQNKLFEAFPKLFRQKDLPVTESAMGWGIDCPDEWYDAIYKACQLIQNYCNDREQIEFTQVKEKFGQLRMYYTGVNDYVDSVIGMANSWVADNNFKLRQFDE